MTKPDYLIKLMIVGDSCTGHSELMHRFASVTHSIHPAMAATGQDFRIRTVEIGGARCKVQIWVTARSGTQHPLGHNLNCRGVMGFVFAYSVTDAESFAYMPSW
jgi:GTPase SAR1 family protein